jgi:hypothetical protein
MCSQEALTADNLSKRAPADRDLINIDEAHEVSYWTGALNVTKEQLVTAVRALAPWSKDVKKRLGTN